MRALLAASVLLFASFASAQQSRWVHLGPDGKLVYAQTPQGDSIVDFSYAGYRGGGIALPSDPATLTVTPSGNDDTAAIQQALDAVSKRPLDSNGHRGSVWLAPGVFHCSGTLNIKTSGIVLRGVGPVASKGGTTIELTGKPHLGIDITGEFHEQPLAKPTSITDDYVPSGTHTLHVADATGIQPGTTLRITKPDSPAWVKFMGMDHLTRTGRDEHWIGEDLKIYRRVAAVNGNTITLEVPLTDNIDARFLDGSRAPAQAVAITGLISEVGVEGLAITAPSRAIDYGEDTEFDGIHMDNVVDSWLRALHLEDTTNSIRIEKGAARITVASVNVEQHASVTSSAKNFQFSSDGTQILFDRITGAGNTLFYFATQARQQGPTVVLNCLFLGDGHMEPHQRWSTGLLIDNCNVPQGGIDLINRGTMGSGHGWTIGWSVLWNNRASEITLQRPPGTLNWSIGDRGRQKSAPMPLSTGQKGRDLPQGVIESPGKPVEPTSLYLEQLRERLGPQAIVAIGYDANAHQSLKLVP